ncbi:hypothetical protein QOZ80_7AG0553790 [Eleusine coracana subsp. coracana]|nr:hypothetical protein QOZ80_7AG0553790 [Eleusine coracana subsp. coracana]
MAPLPILADELIEEILIRFLPDDPASLLRAALVCKPWCRVVSGPGFRRRFSEFHRRHRSSRPPVLGFFCTVNKPRAGQQKTQFVPTSPSSFRRLPHAMIIMPNWRPVDALHGRVLFYDMDTLTHEPPVTLRLVVCNPITGKVWRLPVPPPNTLWNAALLCATPGCDDEKFDCGHGHFCVVAVATVDGVTTACVYSSEQHAWGMPVSMQRQGVRVSRGRSAHIGNNNTVYFQCNRNFGVLEYDLCRHELAFIGLPPECKGKCITLMAAEDGGLGFATIDLEEDSELFTWSREVGQDGEGRWVQGRVFVLDGLLSDIEYTRLKQLRLEWLRS